MTEFAKVTGLGVSTVRRFLKWLPHVQLDQGGAIVLPIPAAFRVLVEVAGRNWNRGGKERGKGTPGARRAGKK